MHVGHKACVALSVSSNLTQSFGGTEKPRAVGNHPLLLKVCIKFVPWQTQTSPSGSRRAGVSAKPISS